MATEIKYNDSVIATPEAGQTATLKCKGMVMDSDVVVNMAESENGLPIEVDSLDNALLILENENKVYKCDEKLYQVNKVTSLKGLTIKFNETITPCPVIGDGEVFECSGTMMDKNYLYDSYGYPPNVTAITRHSGSNLTLVVEQSNTFDYYVPTDNSEEAKWMLTDENGNTVDANLYLVIANFDCPPLNENPVYIEWVSANAKVYRNYETVNDIKGFKPNYSNVYDWDWFLSSCRYGMIEKTGDYTNMDWDIVGQYTASFSINGEIITKTFSNLVFPYGDYAGLAFYNTSNDLLVFSGDWGTEEAVVKYNDIVLEDTPTFTTFDCMLNDSYVFLSYVLTSTELVDMGYVNGCAFDEFILPTGTLRVEKSGIHDVTEYAKIEVIGAGSASPAEVAKEETMDDLLESGVIGGVYKFTGTSTTYESGALYVLMVSE